jgi:hypothetical protein
VDNSAPIPAAWCCAQLQSPADPAKPKYPTFLQRCRNPFNQLQSYTLAHHVAALLQSCCHPIAMNTMTS